MPIDEKIWKIVVTFVKDDPDEPVSADVSLLGCFELCKYLKNSVRILLIRYYCLQLL